MENILEFDTDEIKILNQLRYRNIKHITTTLDHNTLDGERKCNDLSAGMYNALCEWMFYVHVYEPTNEDLAKLNNTLFNNKDMLDLEQKYCHKMYPETALLIFPSSIPPRPSLYNHIVEDILEFDKN